jgi:hypothetical protein
MWRLTLAYMLRGKSYGRCFPGDSVPDTAMQYHTNFQARPFVGFLDQGMGVGGNLGIEGFFSGRISLVSNGR